MAIENGTTAAGSHGRDLWKDILERPAGTLAAKSPKNLPARSPPDTARNRADSPSTSNVNAGQEW